jgi:hypothetical protein
MNPRTTGVLFLVAAALGAFVWLWQVRGGEERKQAEEQAKRLFPDLAPEDLRSIELRSSDGHDVRLEFGDQGWRIVRPIDFPADESAMSGLTSNLAELASESTVQEPQAPEVYGLGEGAQVVRFGAKDREHVVRFGARTPVEYNTYATADAGGQVVTVASYRANAVNRSLADLRERRVLRFDRDAVDAIEASWPGGAVHLAKRDGAWRLSLPLDAPADATAVDDFLSDLSFLRADAFLDTPPPGVEPGFARPAFRAVLRAAGAEGGAPREWTFTLGPEVPGGRAARGDGPTVYQVAAARLDDFPREVAAWRDRTLAEFAAADARRVELAFHPRGGQPVAIQAERNEAGWTSQPEPMAPGLAARLVTELSRLRGDDIAADSMGERELASVGLAPPRALLRVFGDPAEAGGEAPKLAEVWLGELDAKRGIFARRADAPTVFLLDAALAEHVPVSLEAFRNRFVSKEPPAAAGAPEAGPELPEEVEDVGLDEAPAEE